MQDLLENVFSTILMPSLGSSELFVAVLMACGFIMIGVSSLLPKGADDDLEWWER
jgi:hypothetical protein